MNAILKEEPPEIDIEQMKVSPGLERIVRHCLEKNPANRFQSAPRPGLCARRSFRKRNSVDAPPQPSKRLPKSEVGCGWDALE